MSRSHHFLATSTRIVRNSPRGIRNLFSSSIPSFWFPILSWLFELTHSITIPSLIRLIDIKVHKIMQSSIFRARNKRLWDPHRDRRSRSMTFPGSASHVPHAASKFLGCINVAQESRRNEGVSASLTFARATSRPCFAPIFFLFSASLFNAAYLSFSFARNLLPITVIRLRFASRLRFRQDAHRISSRIALARSIFVLDPRTVSS